MTNALFQPTTSQQYGDPVCPKCNEGIVEGQLLSWDDGIESHVSCPQSQEHGWKSPLMMPKKPSQPVQRQLEIHHPARQSQKESGVASISSDGRRWEKIGSRREFNGTCPSHTHAFAVSSDNANLIVMALAESGVRDFEVSTDYDMNMSYFSFPTPADKEVATDLLAEKFAPQILLW